MMLHSEISLVFCLVILLRILCQNYSEAASDDVILFDLHPGKSLGSRTNKSRILQVNGRQKCFGKCVEFSWCQSGNFKTTPENDHLYVCELLPSDRFTKRNIIKANSSFEHFNLKTPCHIRDIPCQNEGQCVFVNNTYQCKCFPPFSGKQCEKEPLKSCNDIKNSNPQAVTGVYTIYPDGVQAIAVYCEMDMEGGGWTLVWSYTFTDYARFGHSSNALVPCPTWPKPGSNHHSSTPPLNETDYNAMDFGLWKLVAGNEVREYLQCNGIPVNCHCADISYWEMSKNKDIISI